jgi:hypothetical protein
MVRFKGNPIPQVLNGKRQVRRKMSDTGTQSPTQLK